MCGFFVILIVLGIIIMSPIIAMWAISMFGVPVVYDFSHWFAMLLILMVVTQGSFYSVSSKPKEKE